MTKNDRILGSLVGFAIGDAMGATTEFMTDRQIALVYGKVTEIMGGGWLHLKPGQVTDDTQMTLVVYRAMRDTVGRPDRTLEEICRGFKAWAASNPPDIGGACQRAICGAKSCDPTEWWYRNELRQEKSGVRDLGNGGLMRCLVPCLAGNVNLAREQSYLTHSDNIHDTFIDMYYDLLREALRGHKSQAICIKKEPTGHVFNTFNDCQWWFLKTKSFEDAIIGAVNDGGDADTIAALTGGLAGAFYGFNAIPDRWVQALDKDTLTDLEECANWLTK